MSRSFAHSAQIWADFPALVPGVTLVRGITPDPDVTAQTAALVAAATSRLAITSEAGFPEIQAWRHAFTRMGLKPTQYRCAAESLLRRYRKAGALPRLHPLVDLCNAVSIATGIPVAALDTDRISGDLLVRRASGDEPFSSFSGQLEHPEPGEVVFTDSAGQSHARRWTHRQSRTSAISIGTTTALIVAEALHDTAPDDIRALQALLTQALAATWDVTPVSAVLSHDSPEFTYEP